MVVQAPRLLPRAVGVGPVKQLSVYPVALDKTVDVVTPASAALVALDVGHVELADQVPEYDRAAIVRVPRHSPLSVSRAATGRTQTYP